MSLTLVEALRQVRLQPGTVRAEVDGFTVEVRVSAGPSPGTEGGFRVTAPREPLPPDPIPEEYLRNVMIDPPWIPDPGPWVRVTAERGELSLPKPVTLDDTDLAPE